MSGSGWVNEICPWLNRFQLARKHHQTWGKGHTRFSKNGLVFFVSSRDVTYGPFKRNVSRLSGPSGAQFPFGVWESWDSANVPTQGFRVRDPWLQLWKPSSVSEACRS